MRLPKSYNPSEYEADIYALWEKGRAFEPKNRGNDDYFSIVMPPPNANANLHIGFGLTIAVEDTIVRYQRMQGKATLFAPGADHAGFETWVVYEKKLAEQGGSRFDFSREELYKQVWDFVELNKHNFQSQMRALGASCDWTRFTYTLDNKVVAQAYGTFKKMWEDGYIYRGKRIVNYCTFHGTSFSDIEVVHEDEDTQLWNIAYPLADDSGEVVIATTRPETKLGQAALMVNPNDERYKHLIGKEVNQPLVPDTPIKIIGDEHVDMGFGTGVVTVTPGHDPNDFAVAERHGLPITELITTEGNMSDNVPEQFRGMTVLEAREAVAEELAKRNMLRGVESYTHSVGKCYKCGTVIEPLALEQWFVNMEELKKPAVKALENEEITFYPANKRTQLIRYLGDLKDWNISRQIAWGIPIPAFQNENNPEDWIFDSRVNQETIELDGKTYKRDPDVFDTWFSSGSWPYVTLNYPGGEEFDKFYPTKLLETGFDILYPWVARMIMLGLYTTGKIPFENVYLHGLVTDENRQKMSKSKGNVINPMDVIGEYGSDALRMGLLTGQTPGNNQPFMYPKIVGARNFCNKLWNIARFIEENIGEEHRLRLNPQAKSVADNWILNKLSISAGEISKLLKAYRISEAYDILYHFIWGDLADWYIEASKADINKGILAYVLEQTLKLAHPFAPFITETIWQTLAWEHGTLLITQTWPKTIEFDANQAKDFEDLKNVVEEIRQVSAIAAVAKPKLFYADSALIEGNTDMISKLAKLGSVEKVNDEPKGLHLTSTQSAWLDIDPSVLAEKLKAKRAEHQKVIEALHNRLDNQDYVAKAPAELVEETKAQKAEEQAKLDHLDSVLKSLKG